MQDTRSRKYLLTINNPKENDLEHDTICEALKKYNIRYFALCDETGSQGTYHTHLFLYFENAISFSSIKKMFPPAHIDKAHGTSAENRAYLRKDLPEHNKDADGHYDYLDNSGKRHTGQNHIETFYEYGDCPDEHPGKRSDLEYMYNLIKEGFNNAEILDICGETAILHINKINRLRNDYLVDKYKSLRRLDLKVHYVTGKTGTGKSRNILDEYGDEAVFRVTDYEHPFDNYQNEPVIVFEEYRSSLRLQDMLNFLDIYPCTLPARYSPKQACYNTVFVVSNWCFEQQYSELQKDPELASTYKAWVRRFNGYVKEYYDLGKYRLYDSMQDYLNRKAFEPLPTGIKPPFGQPQESEQQALPFED